MPYVLTGIIVALLLLYFWRERQYGKLDTEKEQAWRLERGALLTRVQHPEIIVGQAEERVIPDEELRALEADESDLVGTIVTNGDGSD